MKLSYDDKVKIYELRQNGKSLKSLSKQFNIAQSGIKYMVRLIDRYGIDIAKKGKNTYYSPELKQEMIDKVLLDKQSTLSVSLDYGHNQVLEKLDYGTGFDTVEELVEVLRKFATWPTDYRREISEKVLEIAQEFSHDEAEAALLNWLKSVGSRDVH